MKKLLVLAAVALAAVVASLGASEPAKAHNVYCTITANTPYKNYGSGYLYGYVAGSARASCTDAVPLRVTACLERKSGALWLIVACQTTSTWVTTATLTQSVSYGCQYTTAEIAWRVQATATASHHGTWNSPVVRSATRYIVCV